MLLRSIKSSQMNIKDTTLQQVAKELKENFKIKSISFQSNKENLKFQRYSNKPKHKVKFNGKENSSSQIQTSMIYQDKSVKAQQTILPNNNRLPLCSITNRRNVNSIINPYHTLFDNDKKYNVIRTKEKLEFYDELFDKTVKVKKFKEDEIPFTHSRILPKVQWMRIDNDIKTDDEQLDDAKKMLNNWLGETIKLIKEDDCYMSKNIDRNFLMLRKTNNYNAFKR